MADNQEKKIVDIWKFLEFIPTWENCDLKIAPTFMSGENDYQKVGFSPKSCR